MGRFAGEQESQLDRELVDRYRAEVGREPGRSAPDHPDAWQWEYRGSKRDREKLLERMAVSAPAPVRVEQGELFGADAHDPAEAAAEIACPLCGLQVHSHEAGCEMLSPVGQEGC